MNENGPRIGPFLILLSDLAINYIAKQSRGHLKEENLKTTLTELLLVSGLFWLVIIIGVIR